MVNKWSLAGYYLYSPNDLVGQPIFVKDGSEKRQFFAQFTFSDINDYFEFLPIQDCVFEPLADHSSYDPEARLYVALVAPGHLPVVIERAHAPDFVKLIRYDSLTHSAKQQFWDLKGEDANSWAVAAPLDGDKSYFASLSSQKFIDTALDKASGGVTISSFAREVSYCSRWVDDWNLSNIPARYREPLFEKISIGPTAFQEILNKYRDEVNSEVDTFLLNIPIELSVNQIKKIRRQELRIAEILRYSIINPDRASKLLELYVPQTKYETLVMPLIRNSILNSNHNLSLELNVANLIPKIFVKYFPIRRGRFIVDFLRVLGVYPEIKRQLEKIYEQKCTTYGVKMYGSVIEGLIAGSDHY